MHEKLAQTPCRMFMIEPFLEEGAFEAYEVPTDSYCQIILGIPGCMKNTNTYKELYTHKYSEEDVNKGVDCSPVEEYMDNGKQLERLAAMCGVERSGVAYQYLITKLAQVDKRRVMVMANSMGANLCTMLISLPAIQTIFMLRGIPYLELIKKIYRRFQGR